MQLPLRALTIALALAASSAALGAGGGASMPSSPPAAQSRQPPSPDELARAAYNDGVRNVARAEDLLADAARQADARKQAKLRRKAGKTFAVAISRFTRATGLRPAMHEAWNYLGYCHRKQGRYDAALAAYDRALTLKPDYAEAIEYRGHAYLGLNRLADAKNAYLTLFTANGRLAASLLAGMRQWVGEHPDNAEFAAWVSERSALAGQAALTQAGFGASWNR